MVLDECQKLASYYCRQIASSLFALKRLLKEINKTIRLLSLKLAKVSTIN